jgi:hypothetical protein
MKKCAVAGCPFSDDHIAVFGCFFENIVSIPASRTDLHPFFACVVDGGLDQRLPDVLAPETFIDLCVIDDHKVRSVLCESELGYPFAVPFDKKCAAAPMFVTLNLHRFIYYIKRKVVKQTLAGFVW